MIFRMFLPLAAFGVALAQAPQSTDLKTYLNLTDAQVEQMRQARRQAPDTVRPLVQQLAEKRRALRAMLDSGSANAAETGALMLEIEAIRKQIQAARVGVQSNVLAVLTPDQKAKLANLEEAAKLAPAVRQAVQLGLIEPPAGAARARGADQRARPGGRARPRVRP